MTRTEKMAKLTRELTALRARMIRIQGEADDAVRDLREIENEVAALVREEPRS